ncbi:MAG: glycosyltransferase [Candidatus Aquicultorales bacterium]
MSEKVSVLSVNKFHYVRGGAERVALEEQELLKGRGHKVYPFSMRHGENRSSATERFFVSNVDFGAAGGGLAKVRASARVIYNLEAKRKIKALVDEVKPDVAHLHNICHQLSPAVIDGLRQSRLPVVMTLHDYKLICPNQVLFVDGRTCERCGGKSFYNAVFHRCTKGSAAASLVNCVEMYLHKALETYGRGVQVFISPSAFLIDKLREHGFAHPRLMHIPNFVDPGSFKVSSGRPGCFVYVGRLSGGKGLLTLVRAAARLPSIRLDLIGEGPLRESLEASKPANVTLHGHLSPRRLRSMVEKAAAVVLPSEWYENCPMVVLEAFAMGKPVIASRIGGIPELIEDEVDGLLFDPGDDEALESRILRIASFPDEAGEMGRAGRRKAEIRYSPENHYERLIDAYEEARRVSDR